MPLFPALLALTTAACTTDPAPSPSAGDEPRVDATSSRDTGAIETTGDGESADSAEQETGSSDTAGQRTHVAFPTVCPDLAGSEPLPFDAVEQRGIYRVTATEFDDVLGISLAVYPTVSTWEIVDPGSFEIDILDAYDGLDDCYSETLIVHDVVSVNLQGPDSFVVGVGPFSREIAYLGSYTGFESTPFEDGDDWLYPEQAYGLPLSIHGPSSSSEPFPSLSLDTGVRFPMGPIALAQPQEGDSYRASHLEVTWAPGGGDGSVLIATLSSSSSATDFTCILEDDGAWTVPHEVASTLLGTEPSAAATLLLMRRQACAYEVAPGEYFEVHAQLKAPLRRFVLGP
jgi:hypothetical protein